MNNNVAWACLNCGAITEHPNVTESQVIRKTTLCLKCYGTLSLEKANSYRLQVVGTYGLVK